VFHPKLGHGGDDLPKHFPAIVGDATISQLVYQLIGFRISSLVIFIRHIGLSAFIFEGDYYTLPSGSFNIAKPSSPREKDDLSLLPAFLHWYNLHLENANAFDEPERMREDGKLL
jgi:hypothetical protein